MPKIRFTVEPDLPIDLKHAGVRYKEGQIVEGSTGFCNKWIRRGFAEWYDEKKEKKPEPEKAKVSEKKEPAKEPAKEPEKPAAPKPSVFTTQSRGLPKADD